MTMCCETSTRLGCCDMKNSHHHPPCGEARPSFAVEATGPVSVIHLVDMMTREFDQYVSAQKLLMLSSRLTGMHCRDRCTNWK